MNWSSLLSLDRRWTARLSVAERPGTLRGLAMVLAHSGDSWFWLAGLAILAFARSDTWRRWSIQIGLIIVATAVLVLTLKFTIRRRRPEGEWGGIYRRTDPHSFPSGHAVRAVLLASLAVGWGPSWLALALVIWAPLVVLARVAMGVHYVSDVIAGALIGVVLGTSAVWLLPSPF
ncbi:MAG: phosphatase PAP2 family protein [Anaerolineales bacterium]